METGRTRFLGGTLSIVDAGTRTCAYVRTSPHLPPRVPLLAIIALLISRHSAWRSPFELQISPPMFIAPRSSLGRKERKETAEEGDGRTTELH